MPPYDWRRRSNSHDWSHVWLFLSRRRGAKHDQDVLSRKIAVHIDIQACVNVYIQTYGIAPSKEAFAQQRSPVASWLGSEASRSKDDMHVAELVYLAVNNTLLASFQELL